MFTFAEAQSWYVGRFFGVPFRLHWSLGFMALLQVVRALFSSAFPYSLIAIPVELLVIASIAFHEMAHALVGRQYGLRTMGITLHAFGGFARLSGEPTNRQQVAISAAGPISNLLLWLAFHGVANVAGYGYVAYGALELADFNLFIALFNLIPAFPMDGGSVLLHALRMNAPYAQASWLAFTIGLWISAPLMVIGLITNNLLIALFFYLTFAACQERLASVGAVGAAAYWKDRLSKLVRFRRRSRTGPVVVDWQKYAPPGTVVRDADPDDKPPTIN